MSLEWKKGGEMDDESGDDGKVEPMGWEECEADEMKQNVYSKDSVMYIDMSDWWLIKRRRWWWSDIDYRLLLMLLRMCHVTWLIVTSDDRPVANNMLRLMATGTTSYEYELVRPRTSHHQFFTTTLTSL